MFDISLASGSLEPLCRSVIKTSRKLASAYSVSEVQTEHSYYFIDFHDLTEDWVAIKKDAIVTARTEGSLNVLDAPDPFCEHRLKLQKKILQYIQKPRRQGVPVFLLSCVAQQNASETDLCHNRMNEEIAAILRESYPGQIMK